MVMIHEYLDKTTFVILIRLDSIERLYNILFIIEMLYRFEAYNIVLCEVDSYNSGVLSKMLDNKVSYRFIYDPSSILYKSKYINEITNDISTQYLCLLDADVVLTKTQLQQSLVSLETNEIVYPYNGYCYNVSPILKHTLFRLKDITFLERNINKMSLLYNKILYGGAVFARTDSYINSGKENEMHFGWGNDDFDRYYRFSNLLYKIHRIDQPLFHLDHPRFKNSCYHSKLQSWISINEVHKTKSSSFQELSEI